MKKFILDVFIAICVFLASWGCAEYLMTRANVVNTYSYKYNYVKNNPAIKTLLIGHSHFENSINPYLMGDSVFDFAISGRWIYYDAQLLPKMIPQMPNLQNVIFPLGYQMPYGSWHYKNIRDIDKDYAYNYAQHMDTYYDRFPENMYLSSALIANKMGMKYFRDEPQDSLGYSRVYGHEDYFENHNVKPNVYEGDTATLCYKEFRLYLTLLAEVCYDNHIRFIAVTCPCADCFVKNTREQGIKNLYDLIDSVRVYYPIEYYNYLNDSEFREDSIYYNCSHLNSIGADMFAIRLKKDLGL